VRGELSDEARDCPADCSRKKGGSSQRSRLSQREKRGGWEMVKMRGGIYLYPEEYISVL